MKLLLITILVNVTIITSQNLVLNPSFEEFESCPNSISQISSCLSISTPNLATTDYYSSCSSNYSSSTPVNLAGLQNPRTGNAYIGILTYQKNTHYTELVQCKLKEPLKANRYYKVSYYVSLAEVSKYYHKSLGAYFSKDSLTSKYFDFRVQNKKYLIKEMNTDFLNNTDTWVLISSLYKAKGNERFLILGNVYGPLWKGFLEKNKKLKSSIKQSYSYYYIDDVSVTLAKNRKDIKFESEEISSKEEIKINNTLTLAQTNQIFKNNSSKMLNFKDIIKETRRDTGFVHQTFFLECLCNFMNQNPTVRIEINVIPQSRNESLEFPELAQERAKMIVKYLKKGKVSKKRLSIAKKTEERNVTDKKHQGNIEFKIIKK